MENPTEITGKAVKLKNEADFMALETWPEIVNQDDYALAGDARLDAKGKIKALDTERFAITRPMDEAKSKVMDFFRPPVDALKGFIEMVDQAMIPYIKKKEEEERQARLKAEAEEKERIQREEEERLALAQEMEESGNTELAEEILSEPVSAPSTPAFQPSKPKAKGTSVRKTTKSECYSKMALIKAIAAGDAPERLLDVNSSMLKRYCEVTGKAPAGCKIYEVTGIVSRT